MHLRVILHGTLLSLGILTLSACLTVQSLQSADPHTLHHRNWWNYYERGRLYLREGQPELAKNDFETAMGLRPGARTSYALDRWRARTYGMHMIENYFPNRELGICFYQLGEPEKALEYLNASLEMETSARAKFYINRTHSRLSTTGAPPEIYISALPDWTNRRTLTLHGRATGTNYIAAITVNDRPEFIELAQQETAFEQTRTLTSGTNRFQIAAVDLSGKRTETNLTVIADFEPPQIVLQSVTPSTNGYAVGLLCRDNMRLDQVQINDKTTSSEKNEQPVTCNIASDETLRMTLTDRAGNQISWELDETTLAQALQQIDHTPPRLILADAGKTITLYNSEYALDIRADDDTALRRIELNGAALLATPAPAFRSLQRLSLTEGTNVFRLAAEDSAGRKTEKTITVVRRKPEYLDRHYRLAVTLSPLSGELPDDNFRRRTELLFGQEITRDPVRFYLLANRQELAQIQSEQTLAQSELADPRTVLLSDRRLDSDLLFVNRVLSDGHGQTVYTQVMDARSGDELFTEDIYLENLKNLPQQVAGLTMKLEQHFPLVQAQITNPGDELLIDAGRHSGIENGTRFIVIQSEGSFEQGHVLHINDHPAELVVSKIESDQSKAIMNPRSAKKHVRSGDYVFTR